MKLIDFSSSLQYAFFFLEIRSGRRFSYRWFFLLKLKVRYLILRLHAFSIRTTNFMVMSIWVVTYRSLFFEVVTFLIHPLLLQRRRRRLPYDLPSSTVRDFTISVYFSVMWLISNLFFEVVTYFFESSIFAIWLFLYEMKNIANWLNLYGMKNNEQHNIVRV